LNWYYRYMFSFINRNLTLCHSSEGGNLILILLIPYKAYKEYNQTSLEDNNLN